MLLAQIAEATKAAEKAIAESTQFGFAAYFLMVFFLVTVAVSLLKWWFVEHPNAKCQRDCNMKIADAVQQMTVTAAATHQVLDENNAWQRAHDARLSAIDKTINARACNWTPPAQPSHAN